jgi:hypothetical protein
MEVKMDHVNIDSADTQIIVLSNDFCICKKKL